MRPPPRAVLLALAPFVVAPSLAAAPTGDRSVPRPRTLASCPALHQSRAGDDGLRLELHNTCAVPVSCALSWVVHCRGRAESPGARSATLDLAVGARDGVVASGAACAPDGWNIDAIHWSSQRRSERAPPAAARGDL